MIEVDIATKELGPTDDVYVVRPGQGSWLMGEFIKHSAVFLDFPALDLDLRVRPYNIPDLRRRVVRSIEVGNFVLGGRKGPPPIPDLAHYSNKTSRRRLGRYVGAIQALYYDLPPGTVVASPSAGWVDDVHVGEITGPAYESRDIAPYDGEPIIVRPVRWLGKKQKASFPEDMRKRMATPNPLMALERSYRETVLRVGYDQYAIDGKFSSRLLTSSDDYSSLDDEDITSFINFIAGVIAVMEEDGGEAGSVTSKQARVALREFRDRVPDLKTNINSKGSLRLLSARVDPLTIAVLMAVALHGGAVQATELKVVNSLGKEAGCAYHVSQQAKGAMSMMAFDDFSEKCEALNHAAHNVELKSPMKAKTVHPKPRESK